jgi:hypothetical protein
MQLRKVILQTTKTDRLVAFYEGLMGLIITRQGKDQIDIKIGSSTLTFQPATVADPFYHFAINIPANKIVEARNWLASRVELVWIDQYNSNIADFTGWNAKSVYFFDPAGNIVELISRFNLNNATAEPFSSAQFLSISEIGLVFPPKDFAARVQQLLTENDLAYFTMQPPLPQFRAIGDDEGLFIVVPEDRNWYPTSIPSQFFPMEVHFDNMGKNIN